MNELTMYQGALPQMTATQGLSMVKLDGAAEQAGQESVNRLAQTVDAAQEAFNHIKDYGTAKAADKRASEATSWYDGEVKRRASLESGHPESLWNEDGTLKEDEMLELRRQYEERISNIQPRFMDSRRGFETHQRLRELMGKAGERSDAYIHGMELSRARKNWEEDWELAVKEGKIGKALGLLGEGVKNGVLSETKAKIKRLGLAKASMGSGVNVRGVDYGGLDAAYAAAAAKDGYLEAAGHEEEQHGENAQSDGGERLHMRLDRPGEVQVGMNAGNDNRQLGGNGSELWAETGDHTGVLRIMDSPSLLQLQEGWDVPVRLEKCEAEVAGCAPVYSTPVHAPASVQLVAAAGNVDNGGEMTQDSARAMVADVALAQFGDSPGLSDDDVVKVFKDSGVFELLGSGNAQVGENAVKGIVQEMKKRGSFNAHRLNTDQMKAIIDAHVDSDLYGRGEEWREMERLKPPVSEGKEWKKPTDEAGRKRWFGLLEVYRKYRDDYNPEHGDPKDLRDEFAEKAAGFWAWYMNGSGLYKGMKEASRSAAKSWYMQEALRDLQEAAQVDETGRLRYDGGDDGGYMLDIDVFEQTLKKQSPLSAAVEKMIADTRRNEVRAHEANVMRVKNGEGAMARLLRMKAAADSKAAAQKAQAEEQKEQDKERRKKDERREAVRQQVALRMPRVGEWRWSAAMVGGERVPMCRVPKAEMQRLLDCGYDGTQMVYVRLGSKDVLVDVGVPSAGNELELNSAACELVQPSKPKGKRSKLQAKRVNGTTDFYYIFKNK